MSLVELWWKGKGLSTGGGGLGLIETRISETNECVLSCMFLWILTSAKEEPDAFESATQ